MKPTRFVADASVMIAWAHRGQPTASTQAMLAAILATKDGPLSNAARKARVATWPVA